MSDTDDVVEIGVSHDVATEERVDTTALAQRFGIFKKLFAPYVSDESQAELEQRISKNAHRGRELKEIARRVMEDPTTAGPQDLADTMEFYDRLSGAIKSESETISHAMRDDRDLRLVVTEDVKKEFETSLDDITTWFTLHGVESIDDYELSLGFVPFKPVSIPFSNNGELQFSCSIRANEAVGDLSRKFFCYVTYDDGRRLDFFLAPDDQFYFNVVIPGSGAREPDILYKIQDEPISTFRRYEYFMIGGYIALARDYCRDNFTYDFQES